MSGAATTPANRVLARLLAELVDRTAEIADRYPPV